MDFSWAFAGFPLLNAGRFGEGVGLGRGRALLDGRGWLLCHLRCCGRCELGERVGVAEGVEG